MSSERGGVGKVSLLRMRSVKGTAWCVSVRTSQILDMAVTLAPDSPWKRSASPRYENQRNKPVIFSSWIHHPYTYQALITLQNMYMERYFIIPPSRQPCLGKTKLAVCNCTQIIILWHKILRNIIITASYLFAIKSTLLLCPCSYMDAYDHAECTTLVFSILPQLGKIVVDLGIVLTSFQIFTFDQVLDTFLHDTGLWIEERELRQNLGKKLLMLECLTGLHDANNGGFDGNGAVFLNPFLVHGGIQGRHRDSDLAKVRRELLVRHERIGGIDLVASG
mmetsp:Transcript_18616/g.51988  ORF Transcript_18616/g.51988 Transcript_18616/m.51988 type:complete len:278 (-) Transcript_18616:2071-2904(-)